MATDGGMNVVNKPMEYTAPSAPPSLPTPPIPPNQEKVYGRAFPVQVLRAHADFAKIEEFLAHPFAKNLNFAAIDLGKEVDFAHCFDGGARPEVILKKVRELRVELKKNEKQLVDTLIGQQLKAAKSDAANIPLTNLKIAFITLVIVALLIVLLVIVGKKLEFNSTQYAGAALLIGGYVFSTFVVRHIVVKAQEGAIRELEQARERNEVSEINNRLNAIEKYFKK